MESSEIRDLIKSDSLALQNQYKETETLFIEPQQIDFEDINGNNLTLWTIFKKDEYFITLDDESKRYGLAFKNILNTFIHLGFYNSLLDAYETLISRNE